MADCSVAAVICRAIAMNFGGVPNLRAWVTGCLDRPAVREAFALKSKSDGDTFGEVSRRIAPINRL